MLTVLVACDDGGERTAPPTAAVVSGSASARGTGTTPSRPLNLILVSLDTLRADRLGVYGRQGRAPTSPALDRLAGEMVIFDQAYSPAPWTLPSHITMLTGLDPQTHGARYIHAKTLSERVRGALLQELLQARGYQTIAQVDGGFVSSDYGFDRGFDVFDDAKMPLVQAWNRALERLPDAETGPPFFLFLHTYAVHCPRTLEPKYAKLFDNESDDPALASGKCVPRKDSALSSEEIEFASHRYDASVRQMDDRMRGFWEQLEQRGYLDRSVIVVTSDHGEELGERGAVGHSASLFPEVLRVPLMIRVPGLEPRRVDSPVSLVDLTPTVLEMLGLPAPAVEGRSLLPLMTGQGGDEPRPVFGETDLEVLGLPARLRLRTVILGRHQLVRDELKDETELYEIMESGPSRRIADDEKFAALSSLLADHFVPVANDAPAVAKPEVEVPAGQLERLRALGYVE